jgi:murein DD-endopeptidase MepM/ murein hydrolase activator NlpD
VPDLDLNRSRTAAPRRPPAPLGADLPLHPSGPRQPADQDLGALQPRGAGGVHPGSGGWSGAIETIAWRAEPVRIEGAIDNSLYEAIDAQVPDSQLESEDRVRLAWDLADIYAWQVDFTRDIQTGDRFRVLYERLVSADGEVRFGRILAGDLTMSGKSLTAFRFDGDGHPAFYDAQGNSLRRAFLRAPVQFRRISSSFARARHHPILGITRRHEGRITRPLQALPSWRPATESSSGPAGRAGTAT